MIIEKVVYIDTIREIKLKCCVLAKKCIFMKSLIFLR